MPAFSAQNLRTFKKLHQTDRIDGMVALAMAAGSIPMEEERPKPSIYEREGVAYL
jgi:phage terminase large subunit-like protein